MVWDLSTSACRHRITAASGVIRVGFVRDTPLAIAGTVDGTVNVWDARDASSKAVLTGHAGMVLDFCQLADTLVTAGDDGTCGVYAL